jgi:hypothetical protein
VIKKKNIPPAPKEEIEKVNCGRGKGKNQRRVVAERVES